MSHTEEPLTYDYEQAAKLLGISVDFLRRRVSAGEIMHNKFGRSVRFTRRHLEMYLQATEQPLLHQPRSRV